MRLKIIGEDPLAADQQGRLRSRIATLFPRARAMVTLPGIHATQRLAFFDDLNRQRAERGLPKLTPGEEEEQSSQSVDLIMEGDTILIRPDPENMPLAFEADELLQRLAPKHRVKFLDVRNHKVHEAVKRRGECWRITPLPKSPREMRQMIGASRIAIHGKEIYYYSKTAGTRYLTSHELARLATLDDGDLRRHLLEIQDFSARINSRGNPEVDFFMAREAFSKADFTSCDFGGLDGEGLRAVHRELSERFRGVVGPEFRRDDPDNLQWRNAMCAALLGQKDELVNEETLLGLSSEFFMQIQWLPGGRIEGGQLIFDPVLDPPHEAAGARKPPAPCDQISHALLYNLVREYGNLEYVNVGRVIGSLSQRPAYKGRRGVYIAQMKQRGSKKEILSIIRMQKWGVREHLDEGKDLLKAIIESEEYTEYVLDRRLGCRQLGMNVPARITARKISERYDGKQKDCAGMMIWSAYFERDYVPGIATDKIPRHRFADDAFALAYARLMGQAAALNMIVGRCDPQGHVLFDDGDEVVLENEQGIPAEIVVADQTGTFADYRRDLRLVAAEYAEPVNRLAGCVPDPRRFAEAYLHAFVEQFCSIQQEYRRRQRAFDTVFHHQKRDEAGSFAYRWERVLERLQRSDPQELAARIRESLQTSCRSDGEGLP